MTNTPTPVYVCKHMYFYEHENFDIVLVTTDESQAQQCVARIKKVFDGCGEMCEWGEYETLTLGKAKKNDD